MSTYFGIITFILAFIAGALLAAILLLYLMHWGDLAVKGRRQKKTPVTPKKTAEVKKESFEFVPTQSKATEKTLDERIRETAESKEGNSWLQTISEDEGTNASDMIVTARSTEDDSYRYLHRKGE